MTSRGRRVPRGPASAAPPSDSHRILCIVRHCDGGASPGSAKLFMTPLTAPSNRPPPGISAQDRTGSSVSGKKEALRRCEWNAFVGNSRNMRPRCRRVQVGARSSGRWRRPGDNHRRSPPGDRPGFGDRPREWAPTRGGRPGVVGARSPGRWRRPGDNHRRSPPGDRPGFGDRPREGAPTRGGRPGVVGARSSGRWRRPGDNHRRSPVLRAIGRTSGDRPRSDLLRGVVRADLHAPDRGHPSRP